MNATATATVDAPKSTPEALLTLERKARMIDPTNVLLDSNNQVTRDWVVVLRKGMEFQHVADPDIWKRVQESQKFLKRFDRLQIRPVDGDWFVEALVAAADHNSVSLCNIKRIDMPLRTTQRLPEDENYRVVNEGGIGYYVERKSDNYRMMNHNVATIALAQMALENMYPKQMVGGR